ncbi:unnamed protein product [Heterobilharzia americana]|nr:unnamed protein product [Heterobilharzia americana]
MFSISELCSETALSYVPTNLALKIYDTKNKEGVPQLTYFDYYTIKYQKMKDISCKINLSLPLFKSLRLTRHQNSTQVNAGLRKNKLSNKPSIFLSDACLVHPLSSWIWFLVSLIPSVLHQMSRALLTAQLFTELEVELKNPQAFSEIKIDPLIMTNNSLSSTTVFLPDRLCDPYFINGEPVKVNDFDFEVDEMTSTEEKEMDNIAQNECERNSITCPHPNYLFEPTTLLAARDAVNLERLEFYGDSFLHFIATLCVYGTSPLNADEGYLSSRRSLLVSNARLYNIAHHFLPPCYSVTSEVCKYDSRLYTRLSDKSLADMIEALLGCFLLHIGLPAAFNLLHYFQICPVDWNTIVSDKNYRIDAPWHFFLQSNLSLEQSYTNEINPSTRFLCISSAYNSLNNSKNRISIGDFEDLHQKFFPLQKKLGYYFKEIELLAEAVTHQSSSSTQIWGNYQRLEFLGDSVLGHIVTDYLFRNCLHSSPGKLSTTRSVIVSNNNLANTVVEHEIHPYIDFGACDLKVCVDEIQNIHRQTDSISERIELLTKKVTLGLNIKVLADVFESILGAVFVDSNGNTKLLSAIILRFLGKSIDCFISTLPVQPLKQLHLLHPDLRYQSSNSMSLNSNECVYELTAWTSGKRVCTTGSTRNEARLRLAEKLGISFNDEENNNSNVS